MLSTMRQSWLLFTLLALVALASAINIEEALHIDGIEEYLHNGMKRQASGTGNSQAPSSETPTPTEEQSSAAPSTPAPTPTEESSSDAPSQTPAPSSDAPTSASRASSAPNTTPDTPASSTPAPSSSRITTPVVRTSALVATSVQQYTTVYTTISDGQSIAVTETGSRTALITTGQAVTTEQPTTQDQPGGSSDGLSEDNKKIIGGVVGGVGGAILLGGLAIVAWRIWGRKKRVAEDDDDLMAGTGSALGDKPQSGSTNSPFQSNLEQYHNPGGRPNAAANF